MNKEDYVSLEVAKLLKEKGFDEPCNWIYDTKEQCFKNSKEVNFNITFTNSILRDNVYCAPTLYEAQKWLRKQGDFVVITPRYSNKYQIIEYEYRIIQYTDLVVDKNRKGKLSPVVYESYEECLNEGILEALKLIYYEI